MKITVFTSNQPRHAHLARSLSAIADEVYCIQECNTVFPGQVEDFYKKSDVMQAYFANVMASEKKIFGDIDFLPRNVRTLAVKSGDLNKLNRQQLGKAMNSDIYIVFGASYIKGWLIDELIKSRAVNIHMGVSPYYRGSSCNFWALYDNRPNYVGATVHELSKGLDSGKMYFHCLPKLRPEDSSFDFTMRSVKVAHDALVSRISDGSIFEMDTVRQDKKQEIRYTRNSDFNDDVAKAFLERPHHPVLDESQYPELVKPYFS